MIESIISITSLPWALKYSAIAVAVKAARIRTSAGWSEVATTTTEWARASPRSRSMNSRTSRPRSPTRPITFTCAVVDLAIIPSREDLPTPDPAKIPSRWPRPQGTRVSRARTPRPTRSWIRGRGERLRWGGGCRTPETRDDITEPVERLTESVNHAAQQLWADSHAERRACRFDRSAWADPAEFTQGHQQRSATSETDNLSRHASVPAAVADPAKLTDLSLKPGCLDDQPDDIPDPAPSLGELVVVEGLPG